MKIIKILILIILLPLGCDDDDNPIVQDSPSSEGGTTGGDGSPAGDCPEGYVVNYDGSPNDGEECVPELFNYHISMIRGDYYFEGAILLDQIEIAEDDWVGAFRDSNNDGVGDICVGSRRWGNCGGSICDIPVMGAGNMPHGLTDGYMNNDEVPIFQIFQSSTSSYYCSSPNVELPFPGNIELLTNFLIGSECD